MIVETLVMEKQPVRYAVYNKNKLLILTYDWKFAQRLKQILETHDYPKSYSIVVSKK